MIKSRPIWRDKIIFDHQYLRLLSTVFLFFFVSFFINSCTPKMFRDLKSAEGIFAKEKTQLFRPGLKESLVYKTVIKYKEREFSSLTYFNELNDSVFKIVLLTTFGNTLLETEISKDKFIVNNVISYLDRKPILNLFESDWRLMLAGNFSDETPFLYSDNPGETIFGLGKNRKHQLYHYSTVKNAMTAIESFKGSSKKVIVEVETFRDSQPANFSIEHPSLHLKLNFSLLKKVSNEIIE
ncbi:hypothetical protein BH11BAC1_BH11BAC1_04810 [soil metagenome]